MAKNINTAEERSLKSGLFIMGRTPNGCLVYIPSEEFGGNSGAGVLDTRLNEQQLIGEIDNNPNLGSAYYEGLRIYTQEEGREYLWTESTEANKNVPKLLTNDYVYPIPTYIDGRDYSGKKYNFYLNAYRPEQIENKLSLKIDKESISNEIDSESETTVASSKALYDAKASMLSGIKGEALTTTTPSASGFERYIVHTAGTYTNFKDSNGAAIIVTDADFSIVNGVQGNDVFLEVNNGVASKHVYKKGKGLDAYETAVKNGFTGTYTDWFNSLKGANASANIPDYSELVFPLSAGSSYFYDGKIYQVKSGQTLLQTDSPTGEKVTLRLSQTVNNITQYVADPSQVFQADLMYNDVFDI